MYKLIKKKNNQIYDPDNQLNLRNFSLLWPAKIWHV
jgi:hypothetical protein